MKLNHLIIIGALCGALLLPSSASSWGVVGLSAGAGGGDLCTEDQGNHVSTDSAYRTTAIDKLYLLSVTITCTGIPTAIGARVRGATSDGAGVVFCVYDDDGTAGAPGTKLWGGANDIYDAGNTVAMDLSDSSINYNFTAGTYYIGYSCGFAGRGYKSADSGGSAYISSDDSVDVFPTPPASAPGNLTAVDDMLEIWLEY